MAHAKSEHEEACQYFSPDVVEAKDEEISVDADETVKEGGGSAFGSYLRVFTYTDRVGWFLNIVAFICMIAAGSVLPLMDIVFGKFVNVFYDFTSGASTPAEFRSGVNKYTLWFVYLFVAKFVLTYVWTVSISTSAIRTTRNLRIVFLRQTLRQEISFFDSPESGSVSASVTTNGNLVNQGISEKLGLTVQAISTFVAAFVVAFAVQWKLTLITICIVPVIIIVTAICVALDATYETAILGIYAKSGQLAEEIFASIRTVHAFWAHPKLSKQYEDILDDARAVGRKKSPVYAVLFAVEFFCIYSGYGLAFWQGFRMYNDGEISQPGKIVTVIFAVILAAQALTQIAPQTVTVSKSAAAAHELFRTIDRESRIDSLSDSGLRPRDCQGDVEFHNVSFAYPSRPSVQVLKGLNVRMPANKTIAIVGPSGSGKSTIVGLLERWFSPSGGRITLDGKSIDEYNVRWLRTKIRLVQQVGVISLPSVESPVESLSQADHNLSFKEPVLFDGTIFQNVAYGLAGTPMADLPDEAKQELVEEACRAAYADEFIQKLPKGYLAEVGQRGVTLSGGQKQRLVIARSIISNPRILLLDEATSALDPTAERIVQKALNNVAVGRTMVLIAHRLSTVRDADRIVVLSGGNVVEQGTHGELVARGGVYERLVRAQDLGQDGEKGQPQERPSGEESLSLSETVSARESLAAFGIPSGEAEKPVNHGLLRCIVIIMGEQRSLRAASVLIFLGCLVGGGTYPALAVLFARVMDAFSLTGQAMVDRGNFYSLMFFVVAIGNLVGYAFMGWQCNVIGQIIQKSYRLEMFDNILRQDMSFFERAGTSTGALASRLSTEPTQLQELLSFNIGLMLIIAINLVASCLLAIIVGWKLGLVLVFGALPLLVFSGYLRIRLEFKLDDDTAARFADSAGIASEAAMAIRTVSSLVLEQDVTARFEAALQHIVTKSTRSLGWIMLWYSLSQSISFLCMALGFWYGGRLVSFGTYTVTQFYTIFIAIIFSGEAAAMLFQYSSSLTKACGAANFVFGLRRTVRPEMCDDSPPLAPTPTPSAGPAIDCKDLHFRYPHTPHIRVLNGVEACIPPGHYAALVGASGCGKTTMVSLLERFYEPTSGVLLLDGSDARAAHLGRHRADIALVQQEPVLFRGTVRDNITLGSLGTVTDEEVLAACRQADAGAFVASLPEGLGTTCGSLGSRFSGGQRQRIAIARALVRKPRLLLLDEATSSLDSQSEGAVQGALEAAARGGGRTTVAIAHRLATVKNADVIFVFASGRVVEAGSHEELLAKRGVYYEMCLGQSLDRAT